MNSGRENISLISSSTDTFVNAQSRAFKFFMKKLFSFVDYTYRFPKINEFIVYINNDLGVVRFFDIKSIGLVTDDEGISLMACSGGGNT